MLQQVAARFLAARRAAPGRQKSCCNLVQNATSCSKISGGPARRAGPPEIWLQLVAKFSKLHQDFWRRGTERRAARNLAATCGKNQRFTKRFLAARRGALGRQKSCCNFLKNEASCSKNSGGPSWRAGPSEISLQLVAKCNKISGGPARRAGPPEILLQFGATFNKLQQDFWRPGAAPRAASNLVATC